MRYVPYSIRIVPYLMLLSMITLVVTAPVCHGEARADILPIDDGNLAKLDKVETKQRRDAQNANQDTSDTEESPQCGSVAIGNTVSSNQQPLARIVPSTTTVIVTGNVYNTANCGH